MVSNGALQFAAERILGGQASVQFLVPPGVDPAFWRPTTENVLAMQKADVVFLNGAGYESWLVTVSLPASRLVDTSQGYADRLIVAKDSVVHQHGPEGEHSHDVLKFTTWLSPDLALLQARQVRDWATQNVADTNAIQTNFSALETELIQLKSDLGSCTSKLAGVPLIASHPVYAYLARAGSLSLESVHFEPHELPSVEQWNTFDKLLETHPAQWMLWEDTPTDAIKKELDNRGIGVIVFRPCGNRPPTGDWLSEMKANLERLSEIGKHIEVPSP